MIIHLYNVSFKESGIVGGAVVVFLPELYGHSDTQVVNVTQMRLQRFFLEDKQGVCVSCRVKCLKLTVFCYFQTKHVLFLGIIHNSSLL